MPPHHIVFIVEFLVRQEREYIAMKPNRLVPTLEDDGLILWESNVIVRYLAQKFGAGELCPDDIRRRFDCERWMDWQATTLWPALRPVLIGLVRTPKEQQDPEAQKTAEPRCA